MTVQPKKLESVEEKCRRVLFEDDRWKLSPQWSQEGPRDTSIKRIEGHFLYGAKDEARRRPLKGMVVIEWIQDAQGVYPVLFVAEDAFRSAEFIAAKDDFDLMAKTLLWAAR